MRLQLELYVTSRSPHSVQLAEALRRRLEQALPGQHTLEIVDVIREPLRAEREGIVITPTLVRREPPPVRWFTGALSDPELLPELLRAGEG